MHLESAIGLAYKFSLRDISFCLSRIRYISAKEKRSKLSNIMFHANVVNVGQNAETQDKCRGREGIEASTNYLNKFRASIREHQKAHSIYITSVLQIRAKHTKKNIMKMTQCH